MDSITDHGVNVFLDGELVFLKAGTVVLAVGSRSETGLAEQLTGLDQVYTIGDCVVPRDALTAINEGSAIGRAV